MSIKRLGGISVGGTPVIAGVGPPSVKGSWAPIYDNATVDFDRDLFTRVLYDKGYDVVWQKATICPNRPNGGLAPRDHAINCTICDNGLGFLYFDDETTRMLITGVRMDQSYHAYGRWDGGQVMVTALPEFRINYWDRLTIKNGIARFHELIRRQAGQNFDKLKYTALWTNHVSWVNRAGALVVFAEGRDFTVDGLGQIQWAITTGLPDDGSYYSVAYEYRPRYVVMDLTHQHRESTVNNVHYQFPVQAVAKLDFLIRDESKDGPETVDANPFPELR